jgi:polyisoprenoid-binding protein YceI
MKHQTTLRVLFAVAVLLLALPTRAAIINAVDPAKSEIKFIGKQMGVAAEGQFKKFVVAIVLDTGKLAASRVDVTIEVGSIDTGARESDDEVKGRAWFDVKNHPTAKFVLTGVKSLGSDNFLANGQLTIKGTTHDVTVPFSVKTNADSSIIEGSFPMKRLQFRLGEGPWADTDTVADEVMVRFRFASASKSTPAK